VRPEELGLTSAVLSVFQADMQYVFSLITKKQTPWPLVRERTIPTDRPPLVDEI
jgi:hypothetical protein